MSLALSADDLEAVDNALMLALNPQIVPRGFDLGEAQADLAAADVLRPRLARLLRLTGRAEDSEMALGSDVMSASLEGYALLKVSGYIDAARSSALRVLIFVACA